MNDEVRRRLAALPPEKRKLFLQQLSKEVAAAKPASVPAVSRDVASHPLSFGQQRLWFLDQLEPGSSLYNIPEALRLEGTLDVGALERSFDALFQRHEALRTTFVTEDGQPAQVIAPVAGLPLAVVDLSGLGAEEREAEAQRQLQSELSRPFDLARGPLFRALLLRLAPDVHLLGLAMHHIVSDGWSMGVLVREMVTLYATFAAGKPSPLPALPIQYVDFAAWQRGWLASGELEKQLTYWRSQLEGAPRVLALPTDRPRPAVQRNQGARLPVRLSPELSEALRALCRRENVTPFMALLAAFQTVLFRHSGQEDVVVGSPIAGRGRAELEGLIGLFLNTLVFRTTLRGEESFRALLGRVRETALGAFAHQEIPFEKLVEALQPVRSLSHSPLFQVMLVVQQGGQGELSLPGLSVRSLDVEERSAKFDLLLSLSDTPKGVGGSLTYDTDLFDAATAERLVEHLRVLLEGAVARPDARVADLPLLAEAERAQLAAWNDTEVPYPREETIHGMFEAQVARSPGTVAVRFEGTELTYWELDKRASALAVRLRALGVGPEVRVGVCLERSLELVVALLGVLKAGGAYVPLDAAYPQQRLAGMLEDADVSVLLAQERLLPRLPSRRARVLCLEKDWGREASVSKAGAGGAGNLAYVIFTSGSTGRPKGAMNVHAAVCNRLRWMQETYRLGGGDVVLQKTPFSFDVSVWEFFWPLCCGARLVLAKPGGHQEPAYLAELIEDEGVTTAHFVPSMLQVFLEEESAAERCAGLKRVFCSGEALSLELKERCLDRLPAELHNLYGPTEAAVDVTAYACRRGDARRVVPIGRPIANTRLRILDPRLQPVPVGVPGELYLGGVQVGRGYLGQPALTAERFVPDAHSDVPGARLYRTGDAARYLADGEVEYLGRLDTQVKVRGFRIELGEVESALLQHPGVREAAVVAHSDGPSGARLVAYVVGTAEGAVLRSALKERLPEYMVPAVFVPLDALPLSPNGKLDRKALPAPDGARPATTTPYVAPRNAAEETLANLWTQLLRVERVGIHDNFFERGGDSIVSIQIVARARQAGLQLTPRQLFQHQTVAELAAVATPVRVVQSDQGPVQGAVPLTPIQAGFLARGLPDAHHFNQAVLIELRERVDAAALESALRRLIEHHDALRLRFTRSGDGWAQVNAGPDAPFALRRVDLSSVPEEAQATALEAEAAATQASLSFDQGLLLRAVLFERGPWRPARLLLVLHHLVVDGVSWRVLLEDLETAYLRLRRGERAVLPAKTTSFKAWAERLVAHARSEALERELPLWTEDGRRAARPLPVDRAAGDDTLRSSRGVTVSLDAEETRALLHEAPAAYRAQINDVLLAALAQALNRWSGHDQVLVELEGHGREELFPDVDLSRTVGWFTVEVPLLLAVAPDASPGDAVRQVRDTLRQLPERGLGHGLLRHLGRPEIRAQLAALPRAQVLFNYLGQLDGVVQGGATFSLVQAPIGSMHGERAARSHLLMVNAAVLGGRLELSWSYSEGLHDRATIEAVADGFLNALRAILVGRGSPDALRYTPADFPLAALDRAGLDRVLPAGAPVEDVFPLSAMQQGMLFQSLLEPGAYVQQVAWAFHSRLDLGTFRRAWEDVVARHPILRTSFHWEGLAAPVQVVHPRTALEWQEQDWRGLAPDAQEARLQAFLKEDFARGFELKRPCLLRVAAIQIGEDVHRIVWTLHHLLLDGWSVGRVFQELLSAYDARSRGAVLPLERAPAFRDYIAWLRGQAPERAEAHWRGVLEGFSRATPLPALGGAKGTPGPALRERHLPQRSTTALLAFARQHQLTLNTLVQGAWALLLGRHSGEQDVVFGATVAGRPPELAGVEQMVGPFINSLPVRVRWREDEPVVTWLRRLQAEQTEQRQFEHTPLPQVQAWSGLPRGTSLFDSLLVVENHPIDAAVGQRAFGGEVRDVRLTELPVYPLNLIVLPGQELVLRFFFQGPRFAAEEVEGLLAQLVSVLESVPARPEQRVGEVALQTVAEQRRLIEAGSQTQVDFGLERTAHGLFEAQTARTPDATAVTFEGQSLSYAELDARANQLAHHLGSYGVGSEVKVGLCLEKSLELVVGMLGVLKAGGAFVPLEPRYPAERLGFQLRDAGVAVVVTQDSLADELPSQGEALVCLDSDWAAISRRPATKPAVALNAGALAYVLYTSGSTGTPKGTLLTHGGLANTAQAAAKAHGYGPGSRVLQFASIGFDASIAEVFGTLVSGAALCLASRDATMPGAALHKALTEQRITAVTLTPTVLAQQDAEGLPELRTVISAGEACTPEVAKKWSTGRTLLNAYGPTEVTVCATITGGPVDPERPTIGRPWANVQAYILDERLEPVAVGVPGELFVGGAGLARGYLGRPGLTAERFLPNPFVAGERLYRTGDRARLLGNGELEHLGRLDSQVKVRGVRVELGEVEASLRAFPGVTQAAAVVRDARLIGYVVPPVSTAELRRHLESRLPEVMVPSALVVLDALPLLPSGKVDRSALPSPDGVRPDEVTFVAPRTPTEELLAGLWTQVLPVQRVGANDSFFELGGHSLLGTQLLSRIRTTFGVELPMRELFEAPTVAALAGRIDAAARGTSAPALVPAPRLQPVPLSFAQQRLWFLDQLEPGGSLYNLPAAVWLDGPLDARALEHSFAELARRHEALRTAFQDGPVQVSAPEATVPLRVLEARDEGEAGRLAAEEVARPFDLAHGPLLRATLVRLSEERHLLVLAMHHIVSDAWSMAILIREVVALYEAFSAGRPSPLPALPVQYADFAVWQRGWLQGDVLEAQLAYWRKALDGAPRTLELPTDRPRPVVQRFHGASVPVRLSSELVAGVEALGRREGATPFMVLLAAFQHVLARHSGQEDVSVGSPIAGRNRAETEGLIGFFINTLVLRTRLSGNPTVQELLGRVRETALGAYAHQDVPFEKLVDALQPERDLSRTPLFQVFFALQNQTMPEARMAGLGLRPFELTERAAKFDLELSLTSGPQGIVGELVFNTNLFDADTVERLRDCFIEVLGGFVAQPSRRLSEVPLLTDVAQRQLIEGWNATAVDYPRDACIHALFEEQAARRPDAVALESAARRLTYRELDAEANRLANVLRAHGVGPDVKVALCLERSVELVVAVLGILKAGGAYVPLDVSYPRERLAQMLEDAAPRVLVTTQALASRLPVAELDCLCLDEAADVLARASTAAPLAGATSRNLAYIDFTSGSTGRPKGVCIEHRSVVRLVRGIDYATLDAEQTMLLLAPISFDASTLELWGALLNGAKLAIYPPQPPGDVAELAHTLATHGVTTLHLTAGLFTQVVDADLSALRGVKQLLTGGDVVSAPHVRRVLDELRIPVTACYGPTESTTFTSCHRMTEAAQAGTRVPIGRPIANTQVYLLDAHGQPVPRGVVGELYVGGDGLARGYLGSAAQTAERFVPSPFSAEPGARLYRTGDLARHRADGVLEFLGRQDTQVKVRGFRIEIAEVEAAVLAHPEVKEAVVVAREDAPGVKRLVAYTVGTASPNALRASVAERLPEYMVPALFVALDVLPLTANGKVDRQALPAPDAARRDDAVAYVAPSGEVEQQLATIWAGVLGVERVGAADNFFELGGDSILSLQVVSRARQAGLTLTAKQVFQHQTVGALAAVAVRGAEGREEQGAVEGVVPLTPVQHDFFALGLPAPHHFNQSLLVQARGPVDAALLEQALQHLVAHHDALRLRYVDGRQENAGVGAKVALRRVDLTSVPDDALSAAIEAEATQTQASVDLAEGLLLRAVHFELGPSRPARLLVVIHHLAVDAVSWRVLLEDFETAYRQLAKGDAVALPPKTTSFKGWAERLVAHARSEALERELPAWTTKAREDVPALPVDLPGGANTLATVRSVSIELDAKETRLLLQEVPAAYRARLDEVLLGALGQALVRWTGQPNVLVDVEGHGREELFPDVDLSRTVGWFTAVAPLLLELPLGSSPGDAVRAARSAYRSAPSRGIGHGLLRHLGHDEIRARLAALPPAQVAFNYLGQLDGMVASSALFAPAPEPRGPEQAPGGARRYLLELNGGVFEKKLRLSLSYSEALHQRATIEALARRLSAVLRVVIAGRRSPDALRTVASDFPLARLEQPALDRLLAAVDRVEDLYPLAPLQQGMLFHALLSPTAGMYFEQLGWSFHSPLDLPAFRQAWEAVVARHAILRTGFAWDGLAEPLQVVHAEAALAWQEHDWRALPADERERRMRAFLTEDVTRGFDLARPPLMRMAVLRLNDTVHRVVWSHHHLLLDGWSLGLLLEELFGLYLAKVDGKALELGPRPAYRDYIAWLQRQDPARAEAFWRTALDGFTAPTPLPGDRGPGHLRHDTRPLGEAKRVLSEATTRGLQDFARKHQLTLNTLVQGAWALLLSRHSGEEDVLFGATVAGRAANLPDIEAMIGMFINSLPVRVRVPPRSSAVAWLRTLQAQQTEQRDFEHAPLVKVQGWSALPRGTALFESLLVFENYPVDASVKERAQRVDIRDVQVAERTNFPLTVTIAPGHELMFKLMYEVDRFDADFGERLLEQWQVALEAIAAQPEQQLSALPLQSPAERRRLVEGLNQTRVDFGSERTAHGLFEAQAARTPDATAVMFEGQSFSYAELDARANQLAHHLRSYGVGPEVKVGLCLEKSLELVVGMLGVLKAGGAFVPLEPRYPAERLGFQLRDAGVAVVVTQDSLADELPSQGEALVSLDSDWAAISRRPVVKPSVPVVAESLAYVLYTSGSTGTPKGTLLTHGALANTAQAAAKAHGYGPGSRVLQFASIGFDASIAEVFGTLVSGAALCLATRDATMPGDALRTVLTEQRITAVTLTPTVLAQQDADGLPELKTVISAGEACTSEVAKKWGAGRTLLNAYGPTEVTVCATITGGSVDPERPSIGRPWANVQTYVLDERLEPVPVGMPGELFVGGAGLARGYLGRPDLTAERFLPNPFVAGERLYRTGDRARLLGNGELEHLGRLDSQVKVRGVRVELGEVEASLRAFPGVTQAAAIVRDARLIGYVVPPVATVELRRHLEARLPEVMVPSALVMLVALPLLPSGKVDRNALPAADGTRTDEKPFVAPRTPTEELLAGMWSELLRVDRVGAHDDFMELGGHSLLATQVISRIRTVFGVDLPLRELFDAPTVAALAARIDASARGPSFPLLQPIPRTERLELSFAQQRIWFIHQLDPENLAYNMPAAVRLDGALDLAALERAFAALVTRHESLRTTFQVDAAGPFQVIAPEETLPLPLTDLCALLVEAREPEARRQALELIRRPFDLQRGPLIRAGLFRVDAEAHLLVLAMHHIVSDGWSIGVLIRELAALYDAFTTGRPSPLPPLSLQYADYATWQRRWLRGDALEAQLTYWRKALEEAPQVLELPTDHPRPAIQTSRAALERLALSAELSTAIRGLGRREGATPFMVLMAAFQTLLARYSGQRDVVVGTDLANRNHSGTEGLIGFFINPLPLRARLDDALSFRGLLAQVRETALGAYAHQDLPFEELVKALNPERSMGRAPLFQVNLSLQTVENVALDVPGLSIRGTGLEEEVPTTKFDLTVSVLDHPAGLRLVAEYSTDLFEGSTVARMLTGLRTLLEGAVADPERPVLALPLVSAEDRRQLLDAWSVTRRDPPLEGLAPQRFEAQAQRTPDKVAVELGSDRLTYAELNERANQLAHHLRARGVSPEVRVGLCMEKSLEMAVAILGVLKAGGAYVPLDPSYPADRLDFMMREARLLALVTTEELSDELPVPPGVQRVLIDADAIMRAPTHDPAPTALPDNLAYVIFTSGSTGRPKGTLLTHRGLARTALSAIETRGITAESRVLLFASFSFDSSVSDLFSTLLAGGTLILAVRDALLPGPPLAAVLRDHAVTIATLTPSVLAQQPPDDLPALEAVVSAGEACSPEIARRWRSGRRLLNEYGPTEVTVCATIQRDVDPERPNIGRPLPDVEVYVLDPRLQPVPPGVPGELYVGGRGLARGYLHRPDLTAERFVPHPFSAEPGARLYRTGDRVRHLPSGELDYVGRTDQQVKLRGFRIELGEIEAILRELTDVGDAVVVLREDTPGNKRLVGYVVATPERTLDPAELRRALKDRLPEHLIPAVIQVLDALPLTPSRKVDRRALPVPEATTAEQEQRYVAPRSEVEAWLAGSWAELLGVKRVGIHDDFFELGGHSLLAMQVISRIRDQFQVELPVRALFGKATVAEVAVALVEAQAQQTDPAELERLLRELEEQPPE